VKQARSACRDTQNVIEEVIDGKGFLFLDHQHMSLVL
jgi:hypothetical protein